MGLLRALAQPSMPSTRYISYTYRAGNAAEEGMFLGRPSRSVLARVALLRLLTLTHDEQNKSHHHYATGSVPVYALPPTLQPEK